VSEPQFDFEFAITPRVAKSGSACGLEAVFGSLTYEALEFHGSDTSRRFRRRWTDRQFHAAIQDVWNHGYRIVSVLKNRAPEPGTTPEFRIENSNLYEGHGSDMKIKGQLP